jgi:hypothetical protein
MKALWCSLFLLALPLRAEQLDQYSQEALTKTMDLLRSNEQRQEEINKSDKAKAVDAQVKALAGTPQNTQKIYELSAEIMKNLVESTKGDTDKMMQIIQQAEKNPSAFADTFTPEQKRMLNELAKEIEKTQGTTKAVP